MFKIEVNNIIYNCVSDVAEMNLNRTREVMALVKENIKTRDKNKELIYLLSNIPLELIEKFSEEHINQILEKITFLYKLELNSFPKEFRIGKRYFKIKNFDELTVAEYAEIEYLFSNYSNEYHILHEVFNVLIAEVTNIKENIFYSILGRLFFKNVIPVKLKKFTIAKKEPENSQLFDTKLDGSFSLLLLHNFNEWSQNLKKEFPDLWPNLEEIEETEFEKQEQKSTNILLKWGLYGQICNISSSIQERDEWYKRNIRELLKYLTFMVIKQREEIRLSKLRNQ